MQPPLEKREAPPSDTLDRASINRLGGQPKTFPEDDNSKRSCQGPRPLAEVMAKVVADTRLRRKARQLYDRPPRLTVETIAALADLAGDREVAEHILDQILAIPDEVLEAFDCCDVPPAPIYEVPR